MWEGILKLRKNGFLCVDIARYNLHILNAMKMKGFVFFQH